MKVQMRTSWLSCGACGKSDQLPAHINTLPPCRRKQKHKNNSLYCITSTVAPHAEYSKNHVLFIIDLSQKAQNLNLRKTAPNLSVQVIKASGSHHSKAGWHPLAEKHCLKENKHSSTTKSSAVDASL